MAKVHEEDVVVTKKQVFWLNPQQKKIPLESIREEDITHDEFVSQMVARAKALHDYIATEKAAMAQALNDYLDTVARDHREKEWEGNAQVSDFGHTQQVCRKMGKFVSFDATLQLAKQKIDQCIIKWGGDSNANLVSIINSTFDVNDKGKLDVQNILSLQKLKITATMRP